MNIGIDNIVDNVGMGFENIVLLIVVLGCLMFFAKDFKIGMVLTFLLSSVCFIAFFNFGLDWGVSLVVMMLSFVLLTLSIYASAKAGSGVGGFV